MSVLKPFIFLLIGLSCYVYSITSKTITHQAQTKTSIGGEIMKLPTANQISINSETFPIAERHKRSQYDFGNENLNDIMNEDLDDNNSNGNGNGNNIQLATSATMASMPAQDYEIQNLSPLTYYFLLQKLRQLQSQEPTYRVRKPRLGRSIDLQLLDYMGGEGTSNGLSQLIGGHGYDIGGISSSSSLSRQLMAHGLNKKSVPFKPRLGKRAKICN